MALDLGSGVSRTLDAVARQFSAVVWQKGRPPLDSELNLMSQDNWESLRQVVQSMMPSGFIMDPTRSMADFKFDPSWTNFFRIGVPKTPMGAHEGVRQFPVLWANVNGWAIPVVGTRVDAEGDLSNVIKLYPAPESDTRLDLVFLEAWQCRVDANPSTTNKPSASTLWKYGNVLYGGTNLIDDLEDPTVGVETTARVQVQYRLRVIGSGTGLGASVSLDVYPDGLGDPNVWGQGASAIPVSGTTFVNMGKELGDPSLWRSGDGDPNNALGTIDGYTYAIPVCAVFRRNSGSYVAVNAAGNPNQNGAFERTPGTKLLPNPLSGDRVLLTADLTFALSPTAGMATNATISVDNLNGSGLEDFGLSPTSLYLMLDSEIVRVSSIDLVNGTITIPVGGRGQFGTASVGHPAGTSLQFYNLRPDGLFADQITETDILDMRRAVNAHDWDYRRLLEHNVVALARGSLHSTWKKAGAGDTQGPVIHEVDYLYANGSLPTPNHTDPLDGPDGIRTVWSDAAAIQPGVTLLLDNEATQDSNHYVGFTNDPLDDTVRWDVGPDFYPSAFMNVGSGDLVSDNVWTNGSSIFLYTGGLNGSAGVRGTFRDGTTRAVRLVMPPEYWKDDSRDPELGFQTPVSMRFVGERALDCAPPGLDAAYADRYPGPMFPWRGFWFATPFIVLGGLLRDSFKTTLPTTSLTAFGSWLALDIGIDFDTSGVFYTQDTNGQFQNDPTVISSPLLRGERTLWGMLTNNGADLTGLSSEVYLVTHGDKDSRNNNGIWKVIGAGTAGYTAFNAPNATSLVIFPVHADFAAVDANANTFTVEIRSTFHNSEDTSSYQARAADIVIGLTDIGGTFPLATPWKATTLGRGSGYDLSMPLDGNVGITAVPSKMLLDMTLLYHPGRGGMARIPDSLVRFAMKGGATENTGGYLRQSRVSVDTDFPAPEDETYWDFAHVQLWNRLPSLGLSAPTAPGYGGNVVGFTEQDRENEVFYDRGSKTLIFRPFRDREMTLQALTYTGSPSFTSLVGAYAYPGGLYHKDCLQLFTGDDGAEASTGKKMGFPVPYEWMPRFGRQDIPYWQRVGVDDPFLPGINHLFTDVADATQPVFNVIGGRSNLTGGNEVTSFFFVTSGATSYARSTTIVGPTNNIPAIFARKTTSINSTVLYADGVLVDLTAVNSSDFGKGLKGIQLPPFYGIARLYGVYTTADYAAKGGRTFKTNRYEMEEDPAPNLLRQDATQQTLFILQDGAKDLTQAAGDHTYIVPSNVLDLTRALTYTDGDTFEDFDYVVECAIFGFAHDWINGNNFVLVRKYDGQGDKNTDGDDPQLEGVHMTIPCPAGFNDQLYVAYNRTVYQGDPFMSRSGDAKTNSDYETRYGQVSMGNQYLLRTPIQQFDSNGNFVPETPNPRGFEILASMDFYTTLGTGKVGGTMYPGTSLDVGYTTPRGWTRMPLESDQPPWFIETRAFTEGQEGNTTRAGVGVVITNASSMTRSNPPSWTYLRFVAGDGTVVDLYGCEATDEATLLGLIPTLTMDDLFRIPVNSIDYTWAVDLRPGEKASVVVPFADVDGDPVLVDRANLTGHILTFVEPGSGDVTLRAINVWAAAGFESLDPDLTVGSVIATAPIGAFPAGYTDLGNQALAGVNVGDVVVLNPQGAPTGFSTAGLIFFAEAGNDTIQLQVYNPTGGVIGIAGQTETIDVAILSAMDPAVHTYTGNLQLRIQRLVSDTPEQETAFNLFDTINDHPVLRNYVIARWDGGRVVQMFSGIPGAAGNENQLILRLYGSTTSTAPSGIEIDQVISTNPIISPLVLSAFFSGGVDFPMNAGNGTSQLDLTGMTERFPLGALLQDSDFLCEDPLRDSASAMKTGAAGPRPVQSLIPLVSGDEEYTRFFGESGEMVSLSDGSISVSSFGAWTEATPTGSRKFRLFRGGGPLFVLSGDNPGGPVDWVSDTFPPAFNPILKGGLLACRALLVRNYYEEIQPNVGSYKVSDGDEIQMVLVTYGMLGTPTTRVDGVTMQGIIGPAGYGEGYAASDRFRLTGKPMYRGFAQNTPDPAATQAAVYPDEQRTPGE